MSQSQPQAAPYSHDVAVAAITSYFRLVSRAYDDPVWPNLLYPPQGGWPQINEENFACFRVNKEIMELLRHIPYFEHSRDIHIMPNIEPASYIEPDKIARGARDSRLMREGEPISSNGLPPHVIGLGGSTADDEYGSTLCVDTKNNCMIYSNWHNTPPLLGLPEDSEVILPDDVTGLEECVWAWRIDTFFEACEKNIKDLKWTPYAMGVSGCIQDTTAEFLQVEREEIRRIMQNAGWPGDDWEKNKKKAFKETRRVLEIPSSDESEEQEGMQEVNVNAIQRGVDDLDTGGF